MTTAEEQAQEATNGDMASRFIGRPLGLLGAAAATAILLRALASFRR